MYLKALCLVVLAIFTIDALADPFLMDKPLEGLFNDQILAEYEAFYTYENLAAYFSRPEVGLMGFAKFFRKSAEEEIEHARKFTEFMNKRNSKVILKNIALSAEDAPLRFDNIESAINLAIKKEIAVSQLINELHKASGAKEDALAQHFLDEFLHEQVESLAKLREMKARLSYDPAAVYLMDKDLR